MRTIDELISDGLNVIQSGYIHGALVMRPLLSGGHDSTVACHLASQHERFTGEVHHIDTGIGSAYTREHVERLCDKLRWKLTVWRSPATYARLVEKMGFPGPGAHQIAYNWLKDRCVGYMVRGRAPKLLITGCRSQESTRRMGHVDPIQVGEWVERTNKSTGKKERRRVKRNRIWCAPCHDWTKAEQQLYMDEFGLPVNKLKVSVGLSGECFCGAFAQPGELELIRRHAPDVAEKIDALVIVAQQAGTPCVWGTRPTKWRVTVAPTGPLCNGCDQRAAACNIEIVSSLDGPAR